MSVSALFVASLLLSGYLFLSIDTEFASGYSEKAFQQVEIGDSKAEVRNLLGEPLRTFQQDGNETLVYSISPSGSNYFVRSIVLDEKNHVIRIYNEFWWD